jgi:redox-sensitive bicupin YhaK (pirin superfamily)
VVSTVGGTLEDSMIEVRRDSEINDKEGGWFRARWHFSFDDYFDPEYTSFGSLRVFNDDRLIPGAVWPLHPHRDIEGLTYVVEGTFQHADSLKGDDYRPLPAGSVQRMTLGSGAWHSEQNGSQTEPMRFIQMWILPNQRGLQPSVEQKVFTREDRTGRLLKAISGDDGGAVLVHQDASVYVSSLSPGAEVAHTLDPGHGLYLYVISGSLRLGGERLTTGDAARIRDESELVFAADDGDAGADAAGDTELIAVQVRLD